MDHEKIIIYCKSDYIESKYIIIHMLIGFSLFEIMYSGTVWSAVSTGEDERGTEFMIGEINVNCSRKIV